MASTGSADIIRLLVVFLTIGVKNGFTESSVDVVSAWDDAAPAMLGREPNLTKFDVKDVLSPLL